MGRHHHRWVYWVMLTGSLGCAGQVGDEGLLGDSQPVRSGGCQVTPNPVAVGAAYTVTADGFDSRWTFRVDIVDADGKRSFDASADEADFLSLTSQSLSAGSASVEIYRLHPQKDQLRASCTFEVLDETSDASTTDAGSSDGGSDSDVVADSEVVTDSGAVSFDGGSAAGYGASVTGGDGGATYWVTNLDDSGPGSLRQGAESSETLWIRFAVNGTILTHSAIEVASHKTIDGRGADITITPTVHDDAIDPPSGAGNIIIHNLKIIGSDATMGPKPGDSEGEPRADGIWLVGNHDIWIDHVTISRFGDKQIGMAATTDVTVSWSHLHGPGGHGILTGAKDTTTREANTRVTVHHTVLRDLPDRQPKVAWGARLHAFNNYIENWRWSPMKGVAGAQLLAENNMFQTGPNTQQFEAIGWEEGSKPAGYVRATGNVVFSGDAAINQNQPDTVFTPSYTYAPAPASTTLRDHLLAHTGWQPTPDETTNE